jgi:uncharacterized membrane protein YkoI
MKRLTVNLALADIRKAGPAYDLPIAVGLLLASEQICGQASARQASAPVVAPAAQAPTPVPTEEPKTAPDTDTVEQQDGTADAETNDGANQPDNEAADAAALASKATVTADQAKATALTANPGAKVVKAELGDENGVIVYSVELSTGADVKVDAQKGTIISTDQAGSDANDGAGDTEAPDAPQK